MATSIRDLVRTLETEARSRMDSNWLDRDCAGALRELGRALAGLVQDGLDEADSPRQLLVQDLAESCGRTATVNVDAQARLTALAGCLADVVTLVQFELGREERWAIAAELGSAVRVVAARTLRIGLVPWSWAPRRDFPDLSWCGTVHFELHARSKPQPEVAVGCRGVPGRREDSA